MASSARRAEENIPIFWSRSIEARGSDNPGHISENGDRAWGLGWRWPAKRLIRHSARRREAYQVIYRQRAFIERLVAGSTALVDIMFHFLQDLQVFICCVVRSHFRRNESMHRKQSDREHS